MNVFALAIAAVGLTIGIGVPGSLYVRRHPECSRTRLGWWFACHRTPPPGPVLFFVGHASLILSWSLNVYSGVAGPHWRAPVWLLGPAAAIAALCFVALCLNLVEELRERHRAGSRRRGEPVR
jgi:hypothetical protein